MLGIEGQDESSLLRSVERCAALGAAHVSAYLLKIEEGTPFGQRRDSLRLPGEDETAALYLTACAALEERGYRQYEISNFARPAGKAAITSNIGTPGPISVSDRRPIPASGTAVRLPAGPRGFSGGTESGTRGRGDHPGRFSGRISPAPPAADAGTRPQSL